MKTKMTRKMKRMKNFQLTKTMKMKMLALIANFQMTTNSQSLKKQVKNYLRKDSLGKILRKELKKKIGEQQ